MDAAAPRSRRALISAAIGGLAASALAALGRPHPAAATDGQPLIVGQLNDSTIQTTLRNLSGGSTTLTTLAAGTSTSISGTSNAGKGVQGNTMTGTAVRAVAAGTGYGVYSTSTEGRAITAIAGTTQPPFVLSGTVGVVAFNGSGIAIEALSLTGVPIRAHTEGDRAIDATSGSTTEPAIIGTAYNATTGVVGVGGNGTPEEIPTETGVYGDSLDSSGVGVHGRSFDGTGALGNTVFGYGVEGYGYVGVYGSGDFVGVVGDVDMAVGVQGWTGVAAAPYPDAVAGVWAGAENGRAALQVQGVVKMNRSGRVQIASGAASKKVTVPGGMTSSSLGFANLQTNRAGYYVQAVVVGTADSSLTIFLNKALTTATYVCWMVIG